MDKKKTLILFCEDENVIRTTTKKMLEAFGYEVITAVNGIDALERYEDRHADIDIVILDNLLPELSGYEVFIRMKKINPKVKALMCSGYCSGKEYQAARKAGICYFLEKPYIIEELIEILKHIQSE
ncbi:MAG: response regulator [Spirochaetales bacterium]|nr:response regulator [Spirochaetales bacterium]